MEPRRRTTRGGAPPVAGCWSSPEEARRPPGSSRCRAAAGDEETAAGQPSLEDANVDAPQLRSEPYIPSQLPLNCSVLSFFTAPEARDVDAFTARLVPGSTDDPGAREACVTNYIDRKLAEHASFATTTYFHPPFAKPAKDRPPGFSGDTVFVDEDELDRYGFQSSLTPQQSYRLGLGGAGRALPLAPPASVRSAVARASRTRSSANLEADEVKSFKKPTGAASSRRAPERHLRGMFADPVYGGNRDYVGWKLIGYPGRPAHLHAAGADSTGRTRAHVQRLRRHAAMHPGSPAKTT